MRSSAAVNVLQHGRGFLKLVSIGRLGLVQDVCCVIMDFVLYYFMF